MTAAAAIISGGRLSMIMITMMILATLKQIKFYYHGVCKSRSNLSIMLRHEVQPTLGWTAGSCFFIIFAVLRLRRTRLRLGRSGLRCWLGLQKRMLRRRRDKVECWDEE